MRKTGLLASCLTIPCLALIVTSNRPQRVTFQGHTGPVRRLSMTFSRNASILASTSDDQTMKLWDVTTGKERATIREEGLSSLFSPDGKTLASVDRDCKIKLWEVATAEQRLVFRGNTQTDFLIAFSPDGLTWPQGTATRQLACGT